MPLPPPADACVFCDIVAGTARAHIVHEDAHTVAFLDTFPASAAHTLVVPRRHATDLFDITADDAAAVMRTVHAVAARIADVLAPDGLTLVQANRPAGWQDVNHVHVHVVPRWTGDPLRRPWTPTPGRPTDLRAVADALRVRT